MVGLSKGMTINVTPGGGPLATALSSGDLGSQKKLENNQSSIRQLLESVGGEEKKSLNVEDLSKLSEDEKQKIKKLAQDFEGIFLDLIFKKMRESVPEGGGLAESSNGEKIFRGMLDSEYAKEMSKQEMTGISKMIEKEITGTMMRQRGAIFDAYKKG
jgi:flagellar protein FlgJ